MKNGKIHVRHRWTLNEQQIHQNDLNRWEHIKTIF